MAAAISSGSAARIRSSGDRNGSKRAGISNEATIAGYGGAVLAAAEFVGDEPFLHMVGDHLFLAAEGRERCAKQIVDIAMRERCAVSAVQPTRESLLPLYGTVGGVFVFIGFTPNSWLIKDHYEHDAAGYVITDSTMQTSIPGLYAAGDLRVQVTRQITTAVGDATTAVIAIEKYLKERAQEPVQEPA